MLSIPRSVIFRTNELSSKIFGQIRHVLWNISMCFARSTWIEVLPLLLQMWHCSTLEAGWWTEFVWSVSPICKKRHFVPLLNVCIQRMINAMYIWCTWLRWTVELQKILKYPISKETQLSTSDTCVKARHVNQPRRLDAQAKSKQNYLYMDEISWRRLYNRHRTISASAWIFWNKYLVSIASFCINL